jgi:serine/threonine-protein kinase
VGSLFAGRYEIEAVLGEGAMGVVFRARHVRIGRTFALKVLHRRLMRPKVVQRFEREAELAGKLTHPNVVPVVDLNTSDDGDLYLVMDFVEGTPLSELLVETPMKASRVIPLARQLCDGLEHAHALGLIHRDFKPENIIITRDSRGGEVARIVDFGLAILRDDMSEDSGRRDRLTTDGMVVGTPTYMSPEQVRGEAIDARSDLFALGIMMFELLTGRLPFDGDGVDVARANLEAQTPRMRVRVTTVEVDPVLEALVARLMEKDPARRPQSAREVRELLDLVENDRPAAMLALGIEPPPAPPPPAPPPPAPPPPEPTERRELHRNLRTGKREAFPRGRSLRIAIAGALALLLLAALLRIATRSSPQPTVVAPVVAQPSIVTVTVPVPVPVEEPAPPSPAPPSPAPVAHAQKLAQVPVAPAPARAPTTSPSAAELAALYRDVGRSLEQLDREKADGLWQRYRWIRLADYLVSPQKRAQAATMLEAIASDARSK